MRWLLPAAMAILMASASPAAERKTKVFLIGHQHDHPAGSHMYMETCAVIAKCLEQTPGVEAVVSNGWPTDASAMKDVKAIVFYSSHGGDILLAPDHRAQAEQMMRDGVGLCAIHWATGAGKDVGDEWLKLLGGWFNAQMFSGLETTDAPLIQLDAKHPISRGWSGMDWHEEYYLNLKFAPEMRPLIRVHVKNLDQVVAWTYERPGSRGGRSFGTTLGHFYDNLKSESFRRILVNGILWSAHREVPKTGAPCKLGDGDFP